MLSTLAKAILKNIEILTLTLNIDSTRIIIEGKRANILISKLFTIALSIPPDAVLSGELSDTTK